MLYSSLLENPAAAVSIVCFATNYEIHSVL